MFGDEIGNLEPLVLSPVTLVLSPVTLLATSKQYILS